MTHQSSFQGSMPSLHLLVRAALLNKKQDEIPTVRSFSSRKISRLITLVKMEYEVPRSTESLEKLFGVKYAKSSSYKVLEWDSESRKYQSFKGRCVAVTFYFPS